MYNKMHCTLNNIKARNGMQSHVIKDPFMMTPVFAIRDLDTH